MPHRDCLIWIGDGFYPTVASYVREAESRGCCRQVPNWPAWLKRGETRVFLAHRDGHACCDTGAVFGYFVLRGVDVILTQADCDEYKSLLTPFRRPKDGKIDTALLRRHWKTPEGAQEAAPLLNFWLDRLPPNSLPFDARDDARRPQKKRPAEPLDDGKLDFLLDILISCEDEGDPERHDAYCVSTDQTGQEADRACGSRVGPLLKTDGAGRDGAGGGTAAHAPHASSREAPPTLYLVDSLARAIDVLFCELLKHLIGEALERGRSRPELIEEMREDVRLARARHGRSPGNPKFSQAVKEAAAKKGWASVPPALRRIAKARGALVVFDAPYAYFKRMPEAFSRSPIEIDGDDLLAQLVRVYGERRRGRLITLPYYEPEPADPRETRTKEQLSVTLARRMRTTKEFAADLLDGLAELIAGELCRRDAVRLRNVGTLSVRQRKGRNSLVKFSCSDVLKRTVRECRGEKETAAHKRRKVTSRAAKTGARR